MYVQKYISTVHWYVYTVPVDQYQRQLYFGFGLWFTGFAVSRSQNYIIIYYKSQMKHPLIDSELPKK